MNTDKQALIKFLCEAKKNTYAAEQNEVKGTRPTSHDFLYEKDDLKYIDTYLGSEQFVGEEALWEDNVPVWGLNYTGRATSPSFDLSILKEALKKSTEEYPYRGPKVFVKGDYTYKCRVEGDFEWFVGCEKIMYKGEKVYESMFQGGVIK